VREYLLTADPLTRTEIGEMLVRLEIADPAPPADGIVMWNG
jgi:hypothetical protein